MATTGDWREMCSCRSQLAVFAACQMPLKFGLPLASLGGLKACWAAAGGRAGTSMATIAPAAIAQPLNCVRIKFRSPIPMSVCFSGAVSKLLLKLSGSTKFYQMLNRESSQAMAKREYSKLLRQLFEGVKDVESGASRWSTRCRHAVAAT